MVSFSEQSKSKDQVRASSGDPEAGVVQCEHCMSLRCLYVAAFKQLCHLQAACLGAVCRPMMHRHRHAATSSM